MTGSPAIVVPLQDAPVTPHSREGWVRARGGCDLRAKSLTGAPCAGIPISAFNEKLPGTFRHIHQGTPVAGVPGVEATGAYDSANESPPLPHPHRCPRFRARALRLRRAVTAG